MAKTTDESQQLGNQAESSILSSIFEKQITFQRMLKQHEDLHLNPDFVKEQSMMLFMEVSEALRETPWKSWKKNQAWNVAGFREELADIQIVLINLIISSGMSPAEFFDIVSTKQNLNFARQAGGY